MPSTSQLYLTPTISPNPDMKNSNTRRRFLESLGITTAAGLTGCTQMLDSDSANSPPQTTDGGGVVGNSSSGGEEAVGEPNYPVKLDLSNAAPINQAYNPVDLPKEGEWALNQSNLEQIDQTTPRTHQIQQTLKQSTSHLQGWLNNARVGTAAVWQTLDWANHDTMMIDITTLASGGIGPGIEITYKQQNGETQTDLLPVRGPDTKQGFNEAYTQNAPQSTWHNGQIGDLHYIDWEAMKGFKDFGKGTHKNDDFEELDVIAGYTNNFIPGVNDKFTRRFEEYEGEIEKLVIDDDYWRELSHAFETEQAKYMEMKQDLARAAEMTEKENALGVHINQNGQTIMQELTPEQYEDAFPFSYHFEFTQPEETTAAE
jgi:hypothetical protein